MTDTELKIYRSLAEKAEVVELVEAGMVLVESASKYPAVLSDTDAAVVSELRARLNGHIKRMDAERLDMNAGARAAEKAVNDEFTAKTAPMRDALKKVDASLTAHIQAKQEAERKARAEREAEERRIREAEERRLQEEIAAKRRADIAKLQAEEAARRAQEAAKQAAERGSQRSAADAAKAAKAAAEARAAAEKAEADRMAAEKAAAAEREAAERRALELASAPVAADTKTVAGKFGSKSGMRENWKYRVVDIRLVPENFLVAPDERVQKATLNALARSMKGQASVAGIEFYNEPVMP
jgi:membrane protein involved in colicin uptake